MSTLPKGWKEEKLSELVDKIIDYRGKTPKKLGLDWSEKGKYKALSAKSVKTGGLVNEDQINLGDEELYKAWMKDEVEYNDILLTSEAPMGEVIIWKSEEKIILSQRLFAIRVKENISPDYMYYYFISKTFQSELLARSSGTTVVGIKQTELLKTNVILPESPNEQKEIASILSSFDKKIELLKEQNQTLETMAQTIFKEWFVDFNYPNAMDEMIDSEMGEIPKGWRVFKLEELVNTVNGYSYKGNELVDESTEALVTLKSFNRNGGFQTRGFKPFQGTPKKEQEVVIGDLIVAHTDLTQDAEVLGNPAFIFESGGFHKMYITMDLVKVNSKIEEIQNSFLYYVMKDKRFKGHCVGYSNGTTVLHLSKKAIPEYKIPLPENLKLAQDFSNLTENFTKKISHNILEIKNLEEIKDSLLPKLMSGQKRVFEYDN